MLSHKSWSQMFHMKINYHPTLPLCKGACSLFLKCMGEKTNLPNYFAFSCIDYTLNSALKQIPLLKPSIHKVIAHNSKIRHQNLAHDIGIIEMQNRWSISEKLSFISENQTYQLKNRKLWNETRDSYRKVPWRRSESSQRFQSVEHLGSKLFDTIFVLRAFDAVVLGEIVRHERR